MSADKGFSRSSREDHDARLACFDAAMKALDSQDYRSGRQAAEVRS